MRSRVRELLLYMYFQKLMCLSLEATVAAEGCYFAIVVDCLVCCLSAACAVEVNIN